MYKKYELKQSSVESACVLEWGAKRNATPLSCGVYFTKFNCVAAKRFFKKIAGHMHSHGER